MALQQITSGDINSTTGTGSTVVLSGTPTIATIDAGASTALTLKSNSTNALILDTSQNLQFNSGYGSVATAYGCRAWVNFNGTGTVSTNQTLRGQGNVTTVYKNGTGDYTVNFTTAMPDANYTMVGTVGATQLGGTTSDIGAIGLKNSTSSVATTYVRVQSVYALWSGTGAQDQAYVYVAIFR